MDLVDIADLVDAYVRVGLMCMGDADPLILKYGGYRPLKSSPVARASLEELLADYEDLR